MAGIESFSDEQKVVKEGREDPLELQDEQVELPLKEQISQTLKKKLDDMDIGQKVVETWNAGNAARQERLDRQRKLHKMLDEFMEPIYRKPQEWMSNLHIPVAFMVSKVFHARMYQAIMGEDPAFQVVAEREANMDRANMVQNLMNYTVKRYANCYQGIADEIDAFLWSWCTLGKGYLKLGWERRFTRFVEVEQEEVAVPGPVVDGQQTVDSTTVERPRKKDEKIFDGPIMKHVPEEDILILGGDGNPDNADAVFHQLYLTQHDLWTGVDQKLFDKEVVKEIIEGGEDFKTSESVNNIKQDRGENAGEDDIDSQEVIDRYHILEAYIKVSLDNSGIESDVVVWVHKDTKEILRSVYLYNINKTGLLPFASADFHKRQGQTSAVGLVELVYSIQEEMDAMHNMKVDFGLISTMPVGFYRASSSIKKDRLPLTPGNLIPVQDPQRDVNFPNMGNRSAFAANEESALFQIISRITGLGDLNFGVIGAQGAARTATGARAIINESNANLDIFLRRANRGFKKALVYLFQMMTQRLPEGFEFRVLGEDGNNYFQQVQSREELKGMFDFEIEPNSSNSNQQIRIQRASQVLQTVQNPLLLQLGIVTPQNLFDAQKNFFEASGIKDWSRFITKPSQFERVFMPKEIGDRILEGIDVPLDPRQDLQGFIAWVDDFMNDDVTAGQITQEQMVALQLKRQEAAQLMAAMEQIRRQQANSAQIQANSGLATQTGAPNVDNLGGGQGAGPEQ